MTADALEHLASLLLEGADYATATGEAITAEGLRIAAGGARQLAQRERAQAA